MSIFKVISKPNECGEQLGTLVDVHNHFVNLYHNVRDLTCEEIKLWKKIYEVIKKSIK
jgi:hypothetical protein